MPSGRSSGRPRNYFLAGAEAAGLAAGAEAAEPEAAGLAIGAPFSAWLAASAPRLNAEAATAMMRVFIRGFSRGMLLTSEICSG